tara:strand:- start:1460 stop:1999 length:540 start_codon:yes stop_codon:yes gene_type:complete
MKYKNIILDRDGVINVDSDQFIKSPDEWIEIENSIDSIVSLQKNGWNVSIATNQSGIGRGLFDLKTLNNIHAKMIKLIEEKGGQIPNIKFCPHLPSDNCNCRKPKPGMYLELATELKISLCETIVVGDSLRDLEAAKIVGAQPILVLTGKGEKTLVDRGLPAGTMTYKNLSEFTKYLLQ